MPKRSLSGIDLQKTSTVDGAIEAVYANLCSALRLWSDFPGLEDKSAVHLKFEEKLGGRFSASWKTKEGTESEVLLASVCAYSRPTVLRISGPLCIEHCLSTALITFELKSLGDKTRIVVRHEATGAVNKALNATWSKAWQNFFKLLKSLTVVEPVQPPASTSINETIAARAIKLFDAVEAEFKDDTREWQLVIERFESLANFALSKQQFANSTKPSQINVNEIDESDIQLEQAYQDLQSRLIQVRMAVATAIATEKQLEQQMQKNKDQSETWLNRAAMAIQQGHPDLADQASQRMGQYLQAAEALEIQLAQQSKSTKTMRQQLTDLESMVQKAYTNKQVLTARSKSAKAILAANETLKNFESADVLSAMAKVESSVLEVEARAKEKTHASLSNSPAIVFSPDSLAQAIVTLEVLLEKFTEIARLIDVTDGDSSVMDNS